jgi:outer membrane protein assembly factor BamB
VSRTRPPVSRGTAVERADLHALLARGEFAVVARGRAATVQAAYPLLVAERLLDLAVEALDATLSRRALFRRIQVGDFRLGIRRTPGDGPLDVSVGGSSGSGETKSLTFPAIDTIDFASAAVAFARRLGDAFTSNDPDQERNLRLRSLATAAEAVADRVDDTLDDDSVTNPEPDSYRSYSPKQRPATAKGTWSHGSKMRFVPKWVATVPALDLSSTFLCGDRIVVGAAREIACLDRSTGAICWRVASARGGSISTPSGVVRIEPDGKIVLFALDTGEVRFATRITPRAAGGATGAIVTMPGLPKLLVVAEGDRMITALDLVTGDVRWRYTGRRPAAYKIRRAGKLLLVTGGDSAIAALDVATGEVVWRVRNRFPFAHSLTLDHDSLFALSGAGSDYHLNHVDPWTGGVRYTVPVEEAPLPGQAPLITDDTVIVPTRDAGGVGVKAWNRHDGTAKWEHAPGLVSPLSAWLVVDDAVLVNSGAGVLLCLDANTGAVRYNHVFSGASEADQPRRLEPVLRNGALFVPQHEVHVVRPRDGEVIGSVPSDLIPDLLRVDEQCTVYVGEESGHLAAFSAAPKLALVR